MKGPVAISSLVPMRALLGSLLLVLVNLATPPHSPAQEGAEPHDAVKDPALKAAYDGYLALKEKYLAALGEGQGHGMNPQEFQAWFAAPENFSVILTALEGVAGAGPEDLKVLAGSNATGGIIKTAILSGRPEALPALKKLAWSGERSVRDVLATMDHYRYLEPPPTDLLLEVVKSAESRLPKDFTPSQESARQYRDFEILLGSVYRKVDDAGREALRGIMDGVLARSKGTEAYPSLEKGFEAILQSPRPGPGSSAGAVAATVTTAERRAADRWESHRSLYLVAALGGLGVLAAGMAWWLVRGK